MEQGFGAQYTKIRIRNPKNCIRAPILARSREGIAGEHPRCVTEQRGTSGWQTLQASNVGAFIIRIRSWDYTTTIVRNPQTSIGNYGGFYILLMTPSDYNRDSNRTQSPQCRNEIFRVLFFRSSVGLRIWGLGFRIQGLGFRV